MAVQPFNSGQKVNVPFIQREQDSDDTPNCYTDEKLIQQYQPGAKKLLLTVTPDAFDQIFSEAATNESVYETAVAPIVEKSLQGFNGTVLCFGQSSSGIKDVNGEPVLTTANKKLELIQREKDAMEEAFIKVQGEVASLAAKLEAVSEELTTVKDDNRELRETLEDVNRQFAELTWSNASLEIQIWQLNNRKECLDENHNDSSDLGFNEHPGIEALSQKFQLMSIELELQEVKLQEENALNEAASVTSKLLTLQEELDQIKLQYDAKVQEHGEQVAKMSAKAMAAIKDRDAAVCTLEAQNVKLAKSLAELESVSKKLKEAEAQLKQSGRIIASLSNFTILQLAKLPGELEGAEKEMCGPESIRQLEAVMELTKVKRELKASKKANVKKQKHIADLILLNEADTEYIDDLQEQIRILGKPAAVLPAPSGCPLYSTDDAPVISKSASGIQTTQPDVVAPASKREYGANQPPPPPTHRRTRMRINWDEPTRSIEELQKKMPKRLKQEV